ncbi:cytochrome P450 10-like [Saccoglossus kowalevskii]|uniref:Cytochrome P450 10-like isoform X1 n=1 Tax=Saccoglossus kowalevskii TaxID=10224 RepID=A0ABM0MYP4_SACKO|nr:PREDICTED: cytochrome P450 10-like isoform X1 [Saccoglossus kowalevskii]XP_006825135.1 PREDICTED: cytochrome P450 10-like isoform X2 [Saccoglossus kowalevskii]
MFSLRQVKLISECARFQQQAMFIASRCAMATSAALDISDDDNIISEEMVVKKFEDIPGPRGLPFIGSLLDYTIGPYQLDKLHLAAIERFREYGPIFKETIGENTFINIIEASDVETLFRSSGKNPARPPMAPLQYIRELRKRNIGLASLQGEEWARVRKPVQQVMLKPKNVQSYIPIVDEVTTEFTESIKRLRREDGEVDNYQNEVYKWALECVGTLALGTRLGCMERNIQSGSDTQKMITATLGFFDTMRDLTFSMPLYKFGIYNKTWKQFEKHHETFYKIAEKHIKKALDKLKRLSREGRLEEESKECSLLSYLLSKKSLSSEEIAMVPVDIMQGGVDTTSHTAIFIMYQLATNPDAQEKLHQEVDSVLANSQEMTLESLQNIPYLKACVKETHRMMPTIDGTTRIPDKDIVLSGFHIPAKTVVRTHCIAGLMHEYFDEPHVFKPERWLRVSSEEIDHHLLLPYGGGTRMCIGRRFAEQELHILIAKLIKNFRIEWHHGPMQQLFRLANAPDVPAQFKFVDREQ